MIFDLSLFLNPDAAIEIYLRRWEEKILIIPERGNNYSNLSASEQGALKNLRNDPTIIIKETDKSSARVVWDREDYPLTPTHRNNHPNQPNF